MRVSGAAGGHTSSRGAVKVTANCMIYAIYDNRWKEADCHCSASTGACNGVAGTTAGPSPGLIRLACQRLGSTWPTLQSRAAGEPGSERLGFWQGSGIVKNGDTVRPRRKACAPKQASAYSCTLGGEQLRVAAKIWQQDPIDIVGSR